MVFTSPAWVPSLPFDPPDSIPISQFMLDDRHGRMKIATSRHPYVCGTTGLSYSASEVQRRVENVAKAVRRRLGLNCTEDNEWDKVIALFSLNTIDYIPLTYAVHRLGGIVTPASSTHSAVDLEHQLRSSRAKSIFTCTSLLPIAREAAKAVGIADDHIFLLPLPQDRQSSGSQFLTFDDLVREGERLPELESLRWRKGQGNRQVAYLCYSSGTSGLPKAVMMSHYNVISNVMQYTTYESMPRKKLGIDTQVALGLLPFSHIYGLIIVTHASSYRGDSVVVLPKYDLKSFLAAVERFKIEHLFLVPPIVVQMIRNPNICAQYDLSSARFIYTGAAPLGTETVDSILKMYPKWRVGQGYGMTETCTVVWSTSELDIDQGSSGSLMPGMRAKLMDVTTGGEITEYGKPGELYIQSPSVAIGYLNDARATAETFVTDEGGRWVRSGDEVLIRKSANGFEHAVVVDRIKELIKVKGHQVAPAELEAHILAHAYVADCAVIQIADESAGELPKAYVVRSSEALKVADEKAVSAAIFNHVRDHKPRHKWLQGGVKFTESIPKSPSGKILRRLLRDKEKEEQLAKAAKL